MSRGVSKNLWKTSRAGRRPARTRMRDEINEEEEEKECVVCYEQFDVAVRSHFPCSHWLCEKCFARVDACPTCRVGKDGLSGEERRARREQAERTLRPQLHHVIAFVGGDVGPLAPENLTVVAPGGVPRGLRDLLPDLLRRNLLADAGRVVGGGRGGGVRVRSLLSPFGEGDHA